MAATPGRLNDLVNRGDCRLDRVELTVLDEADQMADMGFMPQVTALLDQVRPEGQRMLFSATLDRNVDLLVRRVQPFERLAQHGAEQHWRTHAVAVGRASETRLLLLAGHRAAEDVLFADDFARLEAQHSRFQFMPTLTGGSGTWLGRRGRVQAQLREAVRSLAPLDAYVCGRVEMVSEVVRALVADGVPESRIRSEGF